MRTYLIIALLAFTGTIFAQPVRYVFAESGLTLREYGGLEAKKIAVIPFRAEVRITGNYGPNAKIPVLRSVPLPDVDDEQWSLPYVMDQPFVEVEYEGKTGYVYNGYLGRYPPKPEGEHFGLESWAASLTDNVDTLIYNSTDERGLVFVAHYGHEVCFRREALEGGTLNTIVLPGGDLHEGYLVANNIFKLEKMTDWQSFPPEELDVLPELLADVTQDKLYFSGSNSEVLIVKAGGMLIISWGGWC